MPVVYIESDFVDDEAPTLVKAPSAPPQYLDSQSNEAPPETRRSCTLERE